MFFTSIVFAVDFNPNLLKLSASPTIHYDFDGSDLSIPITVSGTPAGLYLLVFTKDRGSSIGTVQNGHLGWHYVNKIDTCLYLSGIQNFDIGKNTLHWNGKDNNNNIVPAGEYTYYMWAYDNINTKQMALKAFTFDYMMFDIEEKGEDGMPLAKPIAHTKPWTNNIAMKWTIGNDPQDSTLIETCAFSIAEGFYLGMSPQYDPTDHDYVYYEIGHRDNGTMGIGKWQWVPNGPAELQVDWADNGYTMWSAIYTGGNADAGVVSDGDYLYICAGNHYTIEAEAFVKVVDFDGTLLKSFDISDWWSSPEEFEAGGQMNGGPNTMDERNGMLFLSCHCSCTKQMLDPVAGMDDEDSFYKWSNTNGDYILDHNFEEDADKPWMCNDYNVGPYMYTVTADDNLFMLCPARDMGAVSFGLLAPDGTGISYLSYAGETAVPKFGTFVVDGETPFDGMYTDNRSATEDRSTPGVWFVGHDTIKGIISNNPVGVEEKKPDGYFIAQNTPNPFNPTTTISYRLASAGNVTIDIFNAAGQKVDTIVDGFMSAGDHTATWNASDFSAGIYFCSVKSGSFSKTVKMTLLK